VHLKYFLKCFLLMRTETMEHCGFMNNREVKVSRGCSQTNGRISSLISQTSQKTSEDAARDGCGPNERQTPETGCPIRTTCEPPHHQRCSVPVLVLVSREVRQRCCAWTCISQRCFIFTTTHTHTVPSVLSNRPRGRRLHARIIRTSEWSCWETALVRT